MTSLLFGIRCPTYETSIVTDFYHVMELWQNAMEPGANPPVDLLPILRHVPEMWASWKTACRNIRCLQRKLYFGLLDQCETRMLEGRRNGCFMEDVLDKNEKYGMSRELSGYVSTYHNKDQL
jgi:hypothetical protein